MSWTVAGNTIADMCDQIWQVLCVGDLPAHYALAADRVKHDLQRAWIAASPETRLRVDKFQGDAQDLLHMLREIDQELYRPALAARGFSIAAGRVAPVAAGRVAPVPRPSAGPTPKKENYVGEVPHYVDCSRSWLVRTWMDLANKEATP